jgi:hypothetical protein
VYNSCKVEYVLYRQLNVITVVCAFDNVIDKYIGCMFNTTFNTISVGKPNLGAAVALMDVGVGKGVVRFVQVDDSTCVVDGTLDGLSPGKYGVFLHEYGDLSEGCNR